ncbi:hypothetical protein GGI20_003553 [Coemansia sp. BCRC 34301]|nr:hypothetical protein GGI20_003553 [Coemansia sp. BCRC 34301]
MPTNAVSLDDADTYTTRDRLVVLSLAAILGAKDWDKTARVLNSSFPTLPSDSVREYTREDCISIYQDAIKSEAEADRIGDENTKLYKSLYSLKGRRLDEIQVRLEHIAQAIEDIGMQSEDRSTIGGPFHAASQNVDASLRDVVGAVSTNAIVKTETEGEEYPSHAAEPAPELASKVLVMANEAERAAHTVLTAWQHSNSGDSVVESLDHGNDNAHSERLAASKPQSPVTITPFSDDGMGRDSASSSESSEVSDTGEARHELSQPPSQPAVGMERKSSVGDAVVDTGGSGAEQGQTLVPVPGGSGSSSAKAAALTLDEQQMRNWKKNIHTVWSDISGHRLGSMFISPIKSADAPNYYEVIRQPLDLKTIKNRIRDEEITTTIEFYRDIMHMLMNALMYNAEDTDVYQMTMEIIPDAQACIEQLLQAEAAVNQPKAGTSGGAKVIGADSGGDDDDDYEDNNDTSGTVLAATVGSSGRGGDDEAEDSDSSTPTKRRRRVTSERASKHLRA